MARRLYEGEGEEGEDIAAAVDQTTPAKRSRAEDGIGADEENGTCGAPALCYSSLTCFPPDAKRQRSS